MARSFISNSSLFAPFFSTTKFLKKVNGGGFSGAFLAIKGKKIAFSSSNSKICWVNISVKEKCDAYTSFDHVGGWNHYPSLIKRKQELSKLLVASQELNISKLKTTPEGLQEYWIQWKNRDTQSDCK